MPSSLAQNPASYPSSPQEKLQILWQRGCDFLKSRYGILGGAMTWVSERNLVSAISNAGGFGVLACGAMSPDLLKQEIIATQSLTKHSFGVNLITMHPQFEELMDVLIETKVSHAVLGGGLPTAPSINTLKKAGIRVICFAPALIIAKKLIKNGTDALILEGNEAGGHIGPVSTSVLAQEILPILAKDLPIFIAGGIGRGEMMISYLEMGASGCQLGTRFVCAFESRAHQNFKQAFIRANARDALVSVQIDARFPVIPVRSLSNGATRSFLIAQQNAIDKYEKGLIDLKTAQLEIEHYWAGTLRKAVVEGDIENGSLMAGQSVGMVCQEQSTHDIIQELLAQAYHALETRTHSSSN
ncbi:MAG: nitronate monooxygenase [Proteobacteria bacterium]|nr:nitronate monooxygenase [Pseudomonadota bacterium]